MRKLIHKIKCYFGKHDYRLLQKLGNGKQRIFCPWCTRSFAKCDKERFLIDWDQEIEDMYIEFGLVLRPLTFGIITRARKRGNR